MVRHNTKLIDFVHSILTVRVVQLCASSHQDTTLLLHGAAVARRASARFMVPKVMAVLSLAPVRQTGDE